MGIIRSVRRVCSECDKRKQNAMFKHDRFHLNALRNVQHFFPHSRHHIIEGYIVNSMRFFHKHHREIDDCTNRSFIDQFFSISFFRTNKCLAGIISLKFY